MAGRTNYDFERREREKAKQAKKEAKAREKAAEKSSSEPGQAGEPPASGTAEPAS